MPLQIRGKRAALYLRVSTEEQTVANQRPALAKLVKARGFHVVATYEENVSAVKLRPQYDAMMRDARSGKFDVLIIWSLDRFGRSTLGNLLAVHDLERAGVHVLSAQETWIDVEGPVRQLLIFILSWIAEQERERIRDRTKAGHARARAEGKHIGRPRKRIVIAEAELEIAKLRKGLGREPTREELANRLHVSAATLKRAMVGKGGRALRAAVAGQKSPSPG
jgi:DNA invertase Pin-like site-specific DNA recombinase